MIARAFVLLNLISIATQNALASDWSSADGAISVSCPDSSRFVQIVNRPFAATWISNDKKVMMGVAAAPVPKGVLFVREDMERAFAKQLNGQILDSTCSALNGHTICKMTALGEFRDRRGFATLYLFAVGDNLYKVTAFSSIGDTRDDPDAQSFLQSLRIPSADGIQNDVVNSTRAEVFGASSAVANTRSLQQTDTSADFRDETERGGKFLVYLIGGATVYFAWRRLSRLA